MSYNETSCLRFYRFISIIMDNDLFHSIKRAYFVMKILL